jgi:hypothetical protein
MHMEAMLLALPFTMGPRTRNGSREFHQNWRFDERAETDCKLQLHRRAPPPRKQRMILLLQFSLSLHNSRHHSNSCIISIGNFEQSKVWSLPLTHGSAAYMTWSVAPLNATQV